MLFGTAEEHGDAGLDRCRAFMPVPGPCQSVQRAEFWEAILALQAFWPWHSGIDYLDVVRSLARLLDHGCFAKAFVNDDDLIAIIQHRILALSPI